MDGKTVLTIDDLMQPFQLPHMVDKHGRAVNIAEMLVESRDVSGEVVTDQPDKHFFGNRFFIGRLASGTDVRVVVDAYLRGPFDKMPEEEWGPYLADNIWKKGKEGAYPTEGDIMAVYWLSKDGELPSVYRGGFRYVNACGYSLPFTLNSPQGKRRFIFRGLNTYKEEYRAKVMEFIQLTKDDFKSNVEITERDSRMDSIFLKYLDKKAFPVEMKNLSERKLLVLIKKEYGADTEKALEQNKTRIVDYTSFLVELLNAKYTIADVVNANKKRIEDRFSCFTAISLFFALDIIYELRNMLRLKDKIAGVSQEDAQFLIYRSLMSAIGSKYNISVKPRYDHFGGKERRKIKQRKF